MRKIVLFRGSSTPYPIWLSSGDPSTLTHVRMWWRYLYPVSYYHHEVVADLIAWQAPFRGLAGCVLGILTSFRDSLMKLLEGEFRDSLLAVLRTYSFLFVLAFYPVVVVIVWTAVALGYVIYPLWVRCVIPRELEQIRMKTLANLEEQRRHNPEELQNRLEAMLNVPLHEKFRWWAWHIRTIDLGVYGPHAVRNAIAIERGLPLAEEARLSEDEPRIHVRYSSS
jgi:hypothetical protein